MRVANWVKTGENAGFPFTKMPAYAALPFIPCLFHLRLWTILFALVSTAIVYFMHRKGYTILWIIRRVKGKMIGNRVSARPAWHIRRFSFLHDPTKD